MCVIVFSSHTKNTQQTHINKHISKTKHKNKHGPCFKHASLVSLSVATSGAATGASSLRSLASAASVTSTISTLDSSNSTPSNDDNASFRENYKHIHAHLIQFSKISSTCSKSFQKRNHTLCVSQKKVRLKACCTTYVKANKFVKLCDAENDLKQKQKTPFVFIF